MLTWSFSMIYCVLFIIFLEHLTKCLLQNNCVKICWNLPFKLYSTFPINFLLLILILFITYSHQGLLFKIYVVNYMENHRYSNIFFVTIYGTWDFTAEILRLAKGTIKRAYVNNPASIWCCYFYYLIIINRNYKLELCSTVVIVMSIYIAVNCV